MYQILHRRSTFVSNSESTFVNTDVNTCIAPHLTLDSSHHPQVPPCVFHCCISLFHDCNNPPQPQPIRLTQPPPPTVMALLHYCMLSPDDLLEGCGRSVHMPALKRALAGDFNLNPNGGHGCQQPDPRLRRRSTHFGEFNPGTLRPPPFTRPRRKTPPSTPHLSTHLVGPQVIETGMGLPGPSPPPSPDPLPRPPVWSGGEGTLPRLPWAWVAHQNPGAAGLAWHPDFLKRVMEESNREQLREVSQRQAQVESNLFPEGWSNSGSAHPPLNPLPSLPPGCGAGPRGERVRGIQNQKSKKHSLFKSKKPEHEPKRLWRPPPPPPPPKRRGGGVPSPSRPPPLPPPLGVGLGRVVGAGLETRYRR